MTRNEIYTAHGMNLMNQYGLIAKGWKFRVVSLVYNRKNVLGYCNHNTKEIQILAAMVANEDHAMIMEIIRHEIAHAIVGPGHGHDTVWRSAARMVGANPRATVHTTQLSTTTIKTRYKYQLALKNSDGTIERIEQYTNRRTKLDGKMLRQRPATLNKLIWVNT